MNKMLKNLLALGLIAVPGMSVYGVASYPGMVPYIQPDGSSLEVFINGDESCHWYTDSEGSLLMPLQDGKLVKADDSFTQKLETKKSQRSKRFPASQYTKYPTTGRQKVLILLVEFSDKKFTNSADAFREMLSKPGYSSYGAAGSAYDYFVENSAGRFIPEFEVFGPVTLPHPMSYYGADDDAKAHEMVSEACRALDSEVNFSDYDRDGDGWADNVYLFYAGYGEADGGGVNSVWPHSANLFSKGERLILDGVTIGSYSCSNELIGYSTRMVGIGTFCHEFSHVLGLPDIYSTNNNSAFTPYYYSLMDHGNYNGDGRVPCALTAYEKYYLGWCEPRELNADGSVRLDPVIDNIAWRVSLPGYAEEYYLLEARMKQGWDAALPGEGLLIWHIDYAKDVWDRNGVNNDELRQRVNLIEADGIETMASSAGDPFPGIAGVTTFSAFKDHTGSLYPFSLNNIKKERDNVSFDFNSSSSLPESVRDLKADEVDDNFFRLSWSPVENADCYLVSISGEEEGRIRPVAEFTAAEIGTPSIKISGLEPEREYSCLVRTVKGVSVSAPAEALKITTSAPGIGYFAPVSLPAEDISDSGFTACWENMDMADSYQLSLFMMAQEASDRDFVGFASPMTLPEGWTSTSNTAMSVKGYYGEQAPSLRFSQNAELLESPLYDKDITSLSFWIRGYKADASARIVVSAFADGKWSDIMTITDISNAAGEVMEWIAPEGKGAPKAVRFTYYGPSGSSVCIDDVAVNFGLSEVKKTIFSNKEVGNVTSFPVSELESGRDYIYMVQGVKNGRISLPSEEIKVTTSGQSAVETVEVSSSESVRIFTITGMEISNDAVPESGIYIIRKGDKAIKVKK